MTDAVFRQGLTHRERLDSLSHTRLTDEDRQIEALAWLIVMGIVWSAVLVVWVCT
ncbi:MAG: hypothetical protein ACYCZR_00905 [Burkholderiales bacterium]